MIKMKPPKVYIHESVYRNELSKKRLDRMIGSMEVNDVQVVDDEKLVRAIKDNSWLEMGAKRTGEIHRKDDPIMVFNTFRFLPSEELRKLAGKYPSLSAYHFLGDGPWTFRDGGSYKNGVCRSAYEIHSAWGCYHACDYCHVKDFLNVMVNLEEFLEHIKELVIKESWQKLYKYDNHTDTIPLEPEYGASELLVNYFAKQEDKYLMLYTKSDNIEHLLDLNHNGHTIINWTLSCNTVAQKIEKKAPSMEDRIKVAQLCQKAGYIVRFRFSPIIPVKNWQEGNREMIEKLFASVKPDLITMDVLGWMTAKQIEECMDLSLFEDEYREMIEKMAMDQVLRVENSLKQIIPHPARLKIYHFFIDEIRKVSPDTPIAICMETQKMWSDMDDKLRMKKEDYACCCGPISVPGHRYLS